MPHFIRIICLLLGSCTAFSQTSEHVPAGYGLAMDARDSGRAVRTIFEGSPADKAGIKAADIIVSINGKSTTGMSNEAIVSLLRSQDEVAIVVERAGASLTYHMNKAPLYTFDRTCVSGNCIDGKGRVKFIPDNGLEYEAAFSNGEIIGECKIYNNNGWLTYTGMVKNRLEEGAGKEFNGFREQTPILLSEGQYKNNIISSGTVYNDDGSIKSSGSYNEMGLLRNGSFQDEYRSGRVYYTCADISYRANKSYVLNGPVSIREKNPSDGRLIAEGVYENGTRTGLFKEWDYGEGLRHHITYIDGRAIEGTIYRLSDEAVIGREVHYKAGVTDARTIGCITAGKFRFGKQEKVVDLQNGESAPIMDLREMCKDTEPVKQVVVNKSSPNPITPGPGPTVDKYAGFKRDVALYNCKKAMQSVVNEVQAASDLKKTLNYQNYPDLSYRFYRLKEKMIGEINRAIDEYRGLVADGYIRELEQMHKTIMYGMDFPERESLRR